MIEVISYKPEHLAEILLRSCHKGERPNAISGPALTFTLNGQPIAIFGWYFICEGVAQVWGLLSDAIKIRKKEFHKIVMKIIESAFDHYLLRRMQMSVRSGFHEGLRWAGSLGFKYEGTMKKYGPSGDDYWLLARVVN